MIDNLSVFLHIAAAVFMISGAVVQVMAGLRMRRATTVSDIAQWASFARSGGWVTVAAAAVSLLTGGHLAGAVWGGTRGGFSNPFITLGVAALLLLAPIGPMLGGARLRRIMEKTRHSDTSGDLVGLQRDVRSPALWGPVYSLIGVALGLIWVMRMKPSNWLVAGGILVGSFALGWLVGVVMSGGRPPALRDSGSDTASPSGSTADQRPTDGQTDHERSRDSARSHRPTRPLLPPTTGGDDPPPPPSR